MDEKGIKLLLDRYRAGVASEEEIALLESWYLQHTETEHEVLSVEERLSTFNNVWTSLNQRKPRRMWPRIAAAASIVLALSATAYFYLKPEKPVQVAQNNPEQIAPVQKGVTLTLNGKSIQLAQKHTGLIAVGIQQADSSLHYVATAAPEMNTLANNGNSKFSVKLADGSDVTLDIGSSLTYPSAFTTNIHEVKLTGQAYFKVKHNAGQRFIVKTKDQTTEDIGTIFNINAYDNEPLIRTTLVEGSIKVNEQLLKPGQQALVNSTTLKVETADMEEVTAWLQDKIVLERQTLETIMRKVARIYGVQVTYIDEEVKTYTYGGAVNTSTKLSSVLNFLRKASGADFKVEGKQLTIFKKKGH